MATMLHGESRRLYSWWWDSHISPKNSKWLQENLTDMDMKVKAMIKLIEEDADSFARRAEMYYKKRPELMKLVEEFYRAYRALAERYDHATGALRQAHRTMAEAFPNQVPLVLLDESPSGSSGTEVEPHTPEMPTPIRAVFDPDDLQKDALGVSSHFHAIKRNGAYSEESDALSSRKGLKQLNEMFAAGEGAVSMNLTEGRVRKGLSFHEEEGKAYEHKSHSGSGDSKIQEAKEKEDSSDVMKNLHEEISRLSIEIQNLRNQLTLESERANKAQNEIESLKDSLSKVNSEKDDTLLQYQSSLDKISSLESEISNTQNELKKLNDEMICEVKKLRNAEELNHTLQLDLDMLEQKAKEQQQELNQKQEELEKLINSLDDARKRCVEAEMVLQSREKVHSQTQEEVKLLGLEIQKGIEKLKDREHRNIGLEEEVQKLKEENDSLNEQNLSSAVKIKDLQHEIINLKETNRRLEVALQSIEKLHTQSQDEGKLLGLEIQRGIEKLKDMEQINMGLEEEVHKLKEENDCLNEQNMSSAAKIKDLQDEIIFLNEAKMTHDHEVDVHIEEKKALQQKLCHLEEERSDLMRMNQGLMEQIGGVSVNAESLQELAHKLKEENVSLNEQNISSAVKIKDLQDEAFSLNEAKRMRDHEVDVHIEEKKALQQELCHLEEERSDLLRMNQGLTEQIKAVSVNAESLQELGDKLKEENVSLNEQNISSAAKIQDLQDEVFSLNEAKRMCDNEVDVHVEEKKALQQELCHLEEERSNLLRMNQGLTEQIKVVSVNAESLQELADKLKEENISLNEQNISSAAKIKDLQDEVFFLNEAQRTCDHEVDVHIEEKKALQKELCHLEEERSNLLRMNQGLTEQIEAVSVNAESLQELAHKLKEENVSLNEQNISSAVKIKDLQDEVFSLNEAKRMCDHEVDVHIEEKKALQQELCHLEERRSDLLRMNQGLMEQIKAVSVNAESLQDLADKLKEENVSLNEQNTSSSVKVKDLQDEVFFLNETKRTLDHKVDVHIEEKKALQQEICHLKEDRSDLEQSNQLLLEQMMAVSVNAEYLQDLVKVLQNGNTELKEICKKHEVEKELILVKLKTMEQLLEKNVFLENSLSDANVELELLRQKITALGASQESLSGEVSTLTVEKALLVSQVEIHAKNVEKISEKNTVLENSLSDASAELECLRKKLKDSEQSCQSLNVQNSSLLDEKHTLVNQVKSVTESLEYLEHKYADLEDKYLSLLQEKDLALAQVKELQDLLKLEKQEHETFILSHKSQLVTLENQIRCLQEESHLLEEELELEELKNMNALLDIFILKRSVCDMKERNLILSKECQKYLEASSFAEKLVSQLEQENLVQKGERILVTEHNEKLKEGIYQMVKTLNINKEVGPVDEISCEVMLQNIMGDIKRLLNCISDAEDENWHHIIEISVLVTLLKQIGVDLTDMRWEKCIMEQELQVRTAELLTLQNKKHELLEMNEELRQALMASNQREEVLKTEMDILGAQLSVLQESHQMLQNEICKHVEENQSLLKELYSLREKHSELVNEHSIVLAEAMTLEHLYFFFRSLNAERMLELKLLSDDLDCLHLVKNDLDYEIKELNKKAGVLLTENMHLKESIIYLEELRSRLLILEFDLNTATNICEELNLQIESMNNLLTQKDTELSEANQKILSQQEMNKELWTVLEALQLDVAVAKMVREELEKKISLLSEGNAFRDKEISCLTEANEMMQEEINRLHEEAGVLKRREKHLTSELQTEIDEVKHCEVEIAALLSDAQTSAVRAALYEEKVFELIVEGESLEISAFVQKEVLNEAITLGNTYIGELKKKLLVLEGENKGLEADLNAYLPFLTSLLDNVSSLEEHTFSLLNLHAPKDRKEQDTSLVSYQHDESSQLSEGHGAVMMPAGVSVLQKLITKVEALKQAIIDTGNLLEREKFAFTANLEAARTEIEELKATAVQGEVQEDSIRQLDESENINDAQSSRVKYGQRMKDIQLDQVSNSPHCGNGVGSYGPTRTEDAEIDDQMLQLWETAERDCSHGTWKASSVAKEYDIQAVEEEKGECPSSELAAEKELSIDKLEIPKRVLESQQEWNRSVLERLASDAQRLSVLQRNVEELKGKMERSKKGKRPLSSEYDTIRAQLKEAEGALLELIDITGKLTNKAKDYSVPTEDIAMEPGEPGNMGRQISEQAWRGSEKIGRLELELQKIQYILLKLEEHQNNRSKFADGRARVLLRDYLYGRRDGQRQKKRNPFCGCIRPKTKGDN